MSAPDAEAADPAENADNRFILSYEEFVSKWVDWSDENETYDQDIRTAWHHLCSQCEAVDGAGYIYLADYDDEEAEQQESDQGLDQPDARTRAGVIICRSLWYAEGNSPDDNDPV